MNENKNIKYINSGEVGRVPVEAISDNGSCYVSGELREYLQQRGMQQTHGAPYHPMTQGKIERN
jgi:transposase InsO family protein